MKKLYLTRGSFHTTFNITGLARLIIEPPLLGILLALVLGLTLVYRLPIAIPIQLGYPEGVYNDAPFLVGFNTAERMEIAGHPVLYRWSTPEAALQFPNLADGVYQFTSLHVFGGPASLTIAGQVLRLEPAVGIRRIALLLPSDAGQAEIGISAAVWNAPDDPRELGVALGGGEISSLAYSGLVPARQPLYTAALTLLLVWIATRALGASQREALLINAGLLLLFLAASIADPLRVGIGSATIQRTCLFFVLALIVLRILLPASARRLGIQLEEPWRRWLLLVTAGCFAIALGGRFFPAGMPGDIGFHTNRFHDLIRGEVLLRTGHRGLATPYPPALYVLLAPLTLLLRTDLLLQTTAAALVAASLPTLFFLLRKSGASNRAALGAAILYGLFPANYMTLVWSFDTHIFAQWIALTASAYLAWNWDRLDQRRIWLGFVALLILVLLGHAGFFVNMSLFVGLLVVVAWLRMPAQRRQVTALALALLVAQLIVWIVYYGDYLDIVLGQSSQFMAGGMNSVTRRQPRPVLQIIQQTFTTGLWKHYAIVPLLLAPLGLQALTRYGKQARPLVLVAGMTFVVSLINGAFPIVTASDMSTRWLLFSAWAVAVCCGVGLDLLWRRGRLGRGTALALVFFVGWWGLRLWIFAMIYYVRPPEPS